MGNIIVTGSSKGIGKAISSEWCKRGNENFYYAISRWNCFDVTDFVAINQVINNFYDEDVKDGKFPLALVNNAAIIETGTILEIDYNSWVNQFNTNVHGVFNCAKSYIQLCISKKQPGKIINIASTAGLGARPGRSAYAATKAAIINFSLSLAEELKPYNIKVYCVCPGAVDTDMRHYIAPDDDFESMMKPGEIGKFVCDLIEDGKYLDNQILIVKK